MTRLFPLLLISLPLLLLLGLSDAAPVAGFSNATPGPLGKCLNGKDHDKCSADAPYCHLRIKLTVDKVYDTEAKHDKDFEGCGKGSSVRDGCIMDSNKDNWFRCFCDSRSKTSCTTDPDIAERLQAEAVALYQKAHPTTRPPTTTPDPNHRCQKDGGPHEACPNSSFCHTKIIYDPGSFQSLNHAGLGCVVKLPDQMLNSTCSKAEPFNISNPIFDCFCPSEVGHACNALDDAMNSIRKKKWEIEGGNMLAEVIKEVVKEEAVEMYKLSQITTPDPNHYCLNGSSPVVCSASSFCHSKIFFDPAGRYQNNHTGFGCAVKLPEGSPKNGCRKLEPFLLFKPAFECFCLSEIGHACNNLDEATNIKRKDIWYRKSLELLTEAEEAQTTTPPPTTTADPNHRCLEGAALLVACNGSSFCHSKIFYNPETLQPSKRIGQGCVENLPDEALNNSCQKVEPFDISDPVFECFCPSEVRHACNALDEEMNLDRKAKWEGKGGKMLTEVVKEVTKEKAVELALENCKKEQTAAPLCTTAPPSITTADENTTSGSHNALFLGCPLGRFLLLLLLLAGPSFSLPFSPTH